MLAQNRFTLMSKLTDSPRLLPLSMACVICVLIAVILGYGAWFLFGQEPAIDFGERPSLAQTTSLTAQAETTVSEAAKTILAPASELPVPSGVVTMGGNSDQPPRRVSVDAFAIAETEVTNDQYLEFIKATGHKAPDNWVKGDYPPGTAYEPVTHISWHDATAYCDWLSTKIGATVRLPTEAQWELAARGPDNFKYPWGNEWNERAATGIEQKGPVRAVKSYPINRSPFGAYDMAGNVWEWVANASHDDDGFPISEDGVEFKVAKGGSANEPIEFISGVSRVRIRADLKSKFLGFRYVVLRGPGAKPAAASGVAAGPNSSERKIRVAEPISFLPSKQE